MKSGKFSNFVKQKDLGIDPADGLAGFGYEGPYAYPQKPEGAAGVAAGQPLPYQNPDEPDDRTGQVWVARDSESNKPSLGSMETKGMGTASSVLKKPDGKVKETNPPHKWPKIANKVQKQAPETKIKSKMTNEQFLKASKEKSTGQMIDLISEDVHEELTPITDLYGNEFTPDPNQTIQYLSGILANSPRMMDRFVIEMKNRGAMNKILESMMQHQNCFDGIVEAFGKPEKGKGHSQQLAKSLHDKYVSALDSVDIAESVDAAPEKRFGPLPNNGINPKPRSIGMADSKGQPAGLGSTGGQNPAGASGGGTNFGGQGMPDSTSGMPDFGQGPVTASRKKLMKAETAAGNLFGASATFPHLKSEMEGACKNGNCK